MEKEDWGDIPEKGKKAMNREGKFQDNVSTPVYLERVNL